jgi:hypothetical protein
MERLLPQGENSGRLAKLVESVAGREMDPRTAAEELIEAAGR